MKKNNIALIVLVLSSLLTACKRDFLEVIDKTVLLKEGYVIDLETTSQFMNGIYIDLAAYYADGTYLPYPEIMADNMKPVKSKTFVAAYNWTFSSIGKGGEGDPTQMWSKYYRIIRNCSFVIEKAKEYQGQNQDKANNILGQALAVRAMLHFTLVNIFAQSYNFTPNGTHLGIPYIQTSEIKSVLYRQTVAEVYTAMINDILLSLQVLPKAGYSKEFMNYQAAKALLARVYLFKEDYVNAKNIAVQVLKDVPVMTTNYPVNLYTGNDVEALFRIPPGASTTDNYNALFMGYYGSLAAGTVYYVATDDIVQLFRENIGDKRNNWIQQSAQGWLILKFPKGVTKNFPIPEGDHYQTLFRSSEMCLTAAEAFEKLNKDDSARYYIDIIRKRANPSLDNITATGSALLDSICKERRKEMAFDGLRMFDLLRWKKAVERQDATSFTAKYLPYPSNKAIAAIPKQDVELSGLLQNVDY